ncbi:hypothetical protein [Salibacterium sp. K-3]
MQNQPVPFSRMRQVFSVGLKDGGFQPSTYVHRESPTALRLLASLDTGFLAKTGHPVVLGTKRTQMNPPLRLVEFSDDEGRFYRVVTNRWDLEAEVIAELYKCRWLRELFLDPSHIFAFPSKKGDGKLIYK